MLQQALILTAHREYAAMLRQHLTVSIAPDARIDVETDPLRAMQLSPQQYDLILLDTVLSGMDCFQLMAVMKKNAGQTRFVVISEEANELYRFQAYHNGADLFLLRPQSDDEWIEMMDQLSRLLEPGTVPVAAARPGEASTLSELIALQCENQESAMVQVDIIGNSGDIFIYEGTVYHAQCSGFSGERAFAKILAWPTDEMRIKVHKLHYVPPRTIERALPELLMGYAEVDVLDIPEMAVNDFAVTPIDRPEPQSLPQEMATLEAPPKEDDFNEHAEEAVPEPNCALPYHSPSLNAYWKINLMGEFIDGCGAIDPTHTSALTEFIYGKMADVSVALEENYFDRLTLIGPELRQELVADNLGVRHALFKVNEVSETETDNFIKWCYGQGV